MSPTEYDYERECRKIDEEMNKEPKAEEYLEQYFPKGKTKFRGSAMVLLALAREECKKQVYNYYFKDIKNPVIISNEQFEKMLRENKDYAYKCDLNRELDRKNVIEDMKKLIEEYKNNLLFIKMPSFTAEQFSWIVKRFDEIKNQFEELGENKWD